MDAELIQIIIQGGAVGVLLAFGYGAYKLARRLIDVGVDLVSNHLDHLTKAVDESATASRRMTSASERLAVAVHRVTDLIEKLHEDERG